MAPLHRHQLARLSSAGWATLLAEAPQGPALDCLAHWAEHQLPLVVTRQAVDGHPTGPAVRARTRQTACAAVADAGAAGPLALGLPAPTRWGRLRLAMQAPRAAVVCFGEFPLLADVHTRLPAATQPAVRHLLAALEACGASARVYGSHGWQAITGLDHVRPGSDLDLWLAVADLAQADAVAQRLHTFAEPTLRLDGELVFADGTAVAWREWTDWRAGRTRALLAKRLNSVALLRGPADCLVDCAVDCPDKAPRARAAA